MTSAKITTGLASSEQDITTNSSELIDFVLLITGRSDDYEDDVIEAVGVEFFDGRENEEKMSLRQSFLRALGKALEEHCLPWKEVNLSEGFSSEKGLAALLRSEYIRGVYPSGQIPNDCSSSISSEEASPSVDNT